MPRVILNPLDVESSIVNICSKYLGHMNKYEHDFF